MFFGISCETTNQSEELKIGDRKSFQVISDMKGRVYPSNDSASYYSFKAVANYLEAHPEWVFEIGVHTDHRGDSVANLKLSEWRAIMACQVFHETFEIESERMVAKGYGEGDPVFSEEKIRGIQTTKEKELAHQRNRRYEITVLRRY
ncbi:OmpA family protein [bacterium SCSIO 12741]|nr:OmpA family protein [bacterium SCSIO 12741]